MVEHHQDQESNQSVDYKTLFAGLCVLCSLVGGAAVSYVISGINDNDKTQWEHLSTNNNTIIANTGRLDRLEERLADMETRLREIERAHNAMKH